MSWTNYLITGYETSLVAYNTPGYTDTFAWIKLSGAPKPISLWFTRSAPTLPNSESASFIYARYGADQYTGVLDTLRNEKPVTFWWNAQTTGAYVGSGVEPVGEGEGP